MKSVINDLFPADSRKRRRKGLVSESQETILSSPSRISPLHRLGKISEQVYCPYCKQTTKTRIERCDSKTTKGVNALLWMGMGDPFALTTLDWCQNTDHYCTKCNSYLARKPYRGPTQAIPEDSVWELPLGTHDESTELPANPDHVSELDGDWKLTMKPEADKEAVLGSLSSPSQESRILNPVSLNREFYEPSLTSHDQMSVLTEEHETEPLELLVGHIRNAPDLAGARFQDTQELTNRNTVERKPVESSSRTVRSTNPVDRVPDRANSTTAVDPEPVPLS